MASSKAADARSETVTSSPWFVILLSVLFTAFIATTYGFGIYLFPVLMPDMHGSLAFRGQYIYLRI